MLSEHFLTDLCSQSPRGLFVICAVRMGGKERIRIKELFPQSSDVTLCDSLAVVAWWLAIDSVPECILTGVRGPAGCVLLGRWRTARD